MAEVRMMKYATLLVNLFLVLEAWSLYLVYRKTGIEEIWMAYTYQINVENLQTFVQMGH
jgi:hypothetical protein